MAYEARHARVLNWIRVLAFAAGCAGAAPAAAADATAPPLPPPADCSIVGADEAGRILGIPLEAADPASRTGGICFFAARSVTSDGSASYALVTEAELPQRRGFFAALARRCGPVAPNAPRAHVCAQFVKLAYAKDLDAYFAARTGDAEASPVPGLDGTAIAAGEALYVRRPDAVLEVVVRIGSDFDLPRTTDLAKLLLARLAPH